MSWAPTLTTLLPDSGCDVARGLPPLSPCLPHSDGLSSGPANQNKPCVLDGFRQVFAMVMNKVRTSMGEKTKARLRNDFLMKNPEKIERSGQLRETL